MFNNKSRLAAALAMGSLGFAGNAASPGWQVQGRLAAIGLDEASGIAVSRRQPDLLWAHNDSGNAPALFGVGGDARPRERVAVEAPAGDWEDIAAFQWQDKAWLAIADTGDNLAWRTEVQILLVSEPDPGAKTVAVERVLRVRYPQGPRDVEAIAVDDRRGQILLLEKRLPPATLYAVDLDGPDQQVAREIGVWPALRGAVAPAWQPRDLPTAMALDAARGELLVLTYLQVLRYRADASGDWGAALARGPVDAQALPRDGALYEALDVDADGRQWVLGEGKAAPLLRSAHGR